MLRENKNKNIYEKDLVKCPYCGHQFDAKEEDKEYVGSIVLYYCVKCGEEFAKNLKVK